MFFSKRFLPYFTTQCLGALNDNVYKNTLLLMVTYSQVEQLPFSVNLFVNVAAALFILPFFLFSAHAGMVADNMDKAALMRRLKACELAIMLCGAAAIMSQHYIGMLMLLFLMGTQSAYFGPAKYSLLPQALAPSELVKGNAWVETGTFLSILLGALTAGAIVVLPHGNMVVSALVVGLALTGYITSRFIPALKPAHKPCKVPFAPVRGLRLTLQLARANTSIWMAILAISWFWFLGATYLTQFPNFARIHLHADATVVSVLLALFSIGIATGSFLCERLSFERVELGILPLGVAGLTLFGLDMLSALPVNAQPQEVLWSAKAFIQHPDHLRFMVALFMIGVSGGIYIVPLYSFIQSRARKEDCAKAIAANNIVNALFMVMSALLAIVFLNVLDRSITELFALMAIMNLLVTVYVYKRVPEFTHRFISYLLCRVLYRVKVQGRCEIPEEGGVLLVSNHVSYVDALLLLGASTRPVRFVMDKSISELPLLKHLFRHVGVIPICSPKRCAVTYNQAFADIDRALENGEVVCIFPEGRLTRDGQLGEFRPGVEKILARRSVPVVPIALQGLWGSFFSRKHGGAFSALPKRFWSKIDIFIGKVMDVQDLNRNTMREQIHNMLTAK